MAQPVVQVMACLGTRPEAIKMAPVIARLRCVPEFDILTVVTGQHRELLDQTLETFAIRPDIDLGLMKSGQDLTELAARATMALGAVMGRHRPDTVLVQGDTTTAFAGALAAAYRQIPVGHVEAGLRTSRLNSPFPEEINRRLISPLARWHFCPTERSACNLRAEGVGDAAIDVTGNTVIDALLHIAGRPLDRRHAALVPARTAPRRILVTMHRRETQGDAQRDLCRMLRRIASRPDVDVVIPVHPNPAVRRIVTAELGTAPGVHLIPPLPYPAFVHAMRDAYLIVTDSGGVQEEAPSLGVPVLVMRDTTERQEGVDAGCVRLSGADPLSVEQDITTLLDDPIAREIMVTARNPYGDGTAADRIVRRLRLDLTTRLDEPPAPLDIPVTR